MRDAETMNMAHQGGELEAPSSTLFAFATALADRGADTLEMDVRATSDDRLVVIHDATVNRTTDGTGSVKDMTLAQIQALDAAHWFSPGTGQYDHTLSADSYPFRGIRTGGKLAPPSFVPNDFRIPELREVLDRFPGVPINIEIKTTSGVGNEGEADRTAGLLAEALNQPKRVNGIIVASLSQPALETFHAAAPDVPVSASAASMVSYISGSGVLEPKPVALQVPMRLGSEDPPALIKALDPWSSFLAVHTWTENPEDENDAVYADLISDGVDGIMTMAPGKLADYLCRAGERRPDGSPRCAEQVPTFTAKPASHSLKKFLKSGLPIDANCSVECQAIVAVRMKPARAKALGIKGRPRPIDYGLVQIGVVRKVAPTGVGSSHRYWAGIYKNHARRMAKVKKIKINFDLRFVDSHGYWMGSWRRDVTLHR